MNKTYMKRIVSAAAVLLLISAVFAGGVLAEETVTLETAGDIAIGYDPLAYSVNVGTDADPFYVYLINISDNSAYSKETNAYVNGTDPGHNLAGVFLNGINLTPINPDGNDVKWTFKDGDDEEQFYGNYELGFPLFFPSDEFPTLVSGSMKANTYVASGEKLLKIKLTPENSATSSLLKEGEYLLVVPREGSLISTDGHPEMIGGVDSATLSEDYKLPIYTLNKIGYKLKINGKEIPIQSSKESVGEAADTIYLYAGHTYSVENVGDEGYLSVHDLGDDTLLDDENTKFKLLWSGETASGYSAYPLLTETDGLTAQVFNKVNQTSLNNLKGKDEFSSAHFLKDNGEVNPAAILTEHEHLTYAGASQQVLEDYEGLLDVAVMMWAEDKSELETGAWDFTQPLWVTQNVRLGPTGLTGDSNWNTGEFGPQLNVSTDRGIKFWNTSDEFKHAVMKGSDTFNVGYVTLKDDGSGKHYTYYIQSMDSTNKDTDVGYVKLPSCYLGDVQMDGDVDISDSAVISMIFTNIPDAATNYTLLSNDDLTAVSGLKTQHLLFADCNTKMYSSDTKKHTVGDNKIDVADLLELNRYLVGIWDSQKQPSPDGDHTHFVW